MTAFTVRDKPGVADTCAQMLRHSADSVGTAMNPLKRMRQVHAVHVNASVVECRIAPIDGLALRRHVRLAGVDDPAAVMADDVVESPLCEVVRDLGAQLYYTPVWFDDPCHE